MTRLSRRQLLCDLPSANAPASRRSLRPAGASAPRAIDPATAVRDFDWGTTTRTWDGRVVREWEIVAEAKTIEAAPGVARMARSTRTRCRSRTSASRSACGAASSYGQCQGQRGVLELRFPETGRVAFHAHASQFAELGCAGLFDVCD